MICRVCGKWFDICDLTQVIYHETHKPLEVIKNGEGESIIGEGVNKKEYVKPYCDKNDPLNSIIF